PRPRAPPTAPRRYERPTALAPRRRRARLRDPPATAGGLTVLPRPSPKQCIPTSIDQCPGHTMGIGALTLTTRARTPQYDNPAIRPSVTGEEVERLDERGRHQDDDAHRHEAQHGGEDHLGVQLRRLLLHPLHALVT